MTKGLDSPAASLSPSRLLASEDKVEGPKNFLPALSPASSFDESRIRRIVLILDLSMSNLELIVDALASSVFSQCLLISEAFPSRPG